MIWLINFTGIALIAFIIWWFLLAKPKAIAASDKPIDIKVHKGIYEPDVIQAKVGDTLNLRFTRIDESPCSESVIFDGLDISTQLPIGKAHTLTLTLNEPGEFAFHCQMNMYRGKLIVTSAE